MSDYFTIFRFQNSNTMSLTRIFPSAHRGSSRVTHSYHVLWFPIALITMWNSFYPFACLFVASFAPREYTKHQSIDRSFHHPCFPLPQGCLSGLVVVKPFKNSAPSLALQVPFGQLSDFSSTSTPGIWYRHGVLCLFLCLPSRHLACWSQERWKGFGCME